MTIRNSDAPGARDGTVQCSFGPVWYGIAHAWEERAKPSVDVPAHKAGAINGHLGYQIGEFLITVQAKPDDPLNKPRIELLRHMIGMLDKQLTELDTVLEEHRKPAERRLVTVLDLKCAGRNYEATVTRHHRDRGSNVVARKAALNKLLYKTVNPQLDSSLQVEFQHGRNRTRRPEIAPELKEPKDIEAVWRAICPELFGTEAARRRQLRRDIVRDQREATRLTYRALVNDPDRLMRLVHGIIDKMLVDAAMVVAENRVRRKR